MIQNYEKILSDCPLFLGCTDTEVLSILKRSGVVLENVPAKKKISTEEDGQGRLGILLSGEILVSSPGEKSAVLNHLKPGNLFGISAFFGSKGAKTELVTKKECLVLFIREDRAEPLWQNTKIRKNLISFLTDRICFLSQKIATFTEGNAKGALSRYLLEHCDETGICHISPSYAALSKELNLGRASLYRAIDELTEENIIKKDKKRIWLLNKNLLENKT